MPTSSLENVSGTRLLVFACKSLTSLIVSQHAFNLLHCLSLGKFLALISDKKAELSQR